LSKIGFLKGNWIIKKKIKKDIIVEGNCVIKNSSKFSYVLKENIKTKINNNFITGYQLFNIFESKKDIIFYLKSDKNKTEKIYNFKKRNSYQSIYFCKKDLYFAKLKIITNNFFTIYTKIKGPRKNLNIFANYYRTI
tara:strand:+ start:1425 stop:1835 length:411 start_codon:yes stop_codon:yes gene_type:complete